MKKISLLILATLVLNLGLLTLPSHTTHAETGSIYDMEFNVKTNLKLGGADGTDQPASYFKEESPIVAFATRIIEFVTYIIGSIALILVIVAGFMFMVSQGNQQKLDEAKDIFKYAIIGIIIVFLSYIITIFIQSIFTSAG